MCLAVPAKVTRIDGRAGTVEIYGNERECLLDLVPEVELGDYVLLHAGFAIQVIDQEEAKRTLRLLEEINERHDV